MNDLNKDAILSLSIGDLCYLNFKMIDVILTSVFIYFKIYIPQ